MPESVHSSLGALNVPKIQSSGSVRYAPPPVTEPPDSTVSVVDVGMRYFAPFVMATFLNVTLPIGGRISLPSSINTYISVVKNTSLMYVIGYPELTTTAINIANLTLETLEALTVLAVGYLTLVWSLSAAIRLLESRLALPETR